MVGVKLNWTGLFIMMASMGKVPHADVVGAVIWAIGIVLMWLDK